jgi:hypothetical protein
MFSRHPHDRTAARPAGGPGARHPMTMLGRRAGRGGSRGLALTCAAIALTPGAAAAMSAPGGPAAGSTPRAAQSPCPPATRVVHGPGGTGCTTRNDSSQVEALVVLITGAGLFAITRGSRARRLRDRTPRAEKIPQAVA